MAMTTINRVDPEQREAVSGIMTFDPDRHGLADFRGLMADLGRLLTPEPVAFEERMIRGPDGSPDVRLVIHRPDRATARMPAILYLHGGGMIAGSPEMMAGAHVRLANETGAVVVAPDYRLAPESPFPAGLEDSYAALTWLHTHAAAIDVDPERISVMGDSGGGGLAAALALLARDRKQVSVHAQILLYPMIDIRTGTELAPSDDPLTGEFVVNRALIRFAWNQVRGGAILDDAQIGFLSPALAADLKGLAPAVIMIGALDLFRDENIAYAQKLLRAGVPTDLLLYAGAVHGFDMLPGQLARDAAASLLSTVNRLL